MGGIPLADTPTPRTDCGYKCGALPECYPLASGLVAPQTDDSPRYKTDKALARGTLFPGLDLPLANIANSSAPDIPAAELMAIQFAAHDLSLYLDTHREDSEAFETYKELLGLYKEGARRYAQMYGPLTKTDLTGAEGYVWLDGPWPWENTERTAT